MKQCWKLQDAKVTIENSQILMVFLWNKWVLFELYQETLLLGIFLFLCLPPKVTEAIGPFE